MSDEHQWHFDYTRLVRDTGFTFQLHRPKSSIVKNIAHIDIEKIILHQDIALVDKNINTVLEYTLDNEQSSVLDQNFVKIFYISQLSVQYLLFCKKYLDGTVAHLKKEVANKKEVTNKLNHKIEELQKDLTNAKSQIKELQSTLSCQLANTQNIPVFQCNQCPKAFSTEEYLLAHIQRRHESSFQVETDKLQSEIKALKERLNNTEKFINYDDEKLTCKIIEAKPKNNAVENTLLTELQHRFEMLKTHVDNELRMLQTQKFDQDKYEKWFETFLRKWDCYTNEKISKSVQSDVKSITSNPSDCQKCSKKNNETEKFLKNDHTTQTDLPEVDQQVCKNCHQNMLTCTTLPTEDHGEDKSVGKAGDTLEKLEEILQQRVTGSIEKLENQMQSFCHKMHEFEKQNFSSHRTTPSPTHSTEVKVVPKPRKKWNPRPMSDTTPYVKTAPPSPKLSSKSLESPLLNEKTSKLIEIKPQIKQLDTKEVTSQPKEAVSETVPKPIIGFDNLIDGKHNKFNEVEENTTSETDSEECKKVLTTVSIAPQAKPRPITSLKNATAALGMQQKRQKEMIDLLNKQLVELGISSDWSSLPTNSYQRALNIIMHQSNLAKKKYSNYNQIKDGILKKLEEEVEKRCPDSGNSSIKRHKRYNGLTRNAKLKVYTTESETESENTIKDKNFDWNKDNAASQSKKAYFNVIQEFNSKAKKKDDISDVSVDTDTSTRKDDVKIEQAKSVLKNYPSVGSLHKKKVFFNLQFSDQVNKDKVESVQIHEDGSTSSIGSSVLDGSKLNLVENFDKSCNTWKVSN